jgi:hypothetical protein
MAVQNPPVKGGFEPPVMFFSAVVFFGLDSPLAQGLPMAAHPARPHGGGTALVLRSERGVGAS